MDSLATYAIDQEIVRSWLQDGPIIGAQFSRDQSRVLTGSSDKTARLWDLTKPAPLRTLQHDSDVNSAQFNRDELRVLTWSDGNSAWLDV